MRFLVDAQLPPALARRIEALGHAAEHVADCGLASAADREIRNYAAAVGAVIITEDEDFVVRKMLESGPAVVWVRIGNTRRADLLRRVEAHFATIVSALERGERTACGGCRPQSPQYREGGSQSSSDRRIRAGSVGARRIFVRSLRGVD